MIRVMYRWQVSPENLEEFTNTWRQTTNHIHDTIEGALGSFMMKSLDNKNEIVTVAKWQSYGSWKTFWGDQNPQAMHKMTQLGERTSVEVFEETEDHTR